MKKKIIFLFSILAYSLLLLSIFGCRSTRYLYTFDLQSEVNNAEIKEVDAKVLKILNNFLADQENFKLTYNGILKEDGRNEYYYSRPYFLNPRFLYDSDKKKLWLYIGEVPLYHYIIVEHLKDKLKEEKIKYKVDLVEFKVLLSTD